jgi:hypothetical protein
VFVQDFIDVPIGVDRVLDRATLRPWLAPLARAAGSAAPPDTADEPGLGAPGHLEVGTPCARADAVIVPLRWDVEAEPGVVLTMSVDLEIVPTTRDETHVALCASYPRPFGRGTTDRSLQRSVAHAVRRFLQSVGATLEREHERAATGGS